MLLVNFVIILALCIIPSYGFIGEEGLASFIDPSQLQFFADHCAKNNVELDPVVLDAVQECLKPVLVPIQAAEMEEKYETICANSAELRKCYLPIFDILEKCIPSWATNEKAFRPLEIFDNVDRAFCTDTTDLPPRIRNVAIVKKAGRSALLCYIQHYKAIGQDTFSCPAVLQLLMDPMNSLKSEKVCGLLDKIESCLLESLDLCGDSKDSAVTYAKQVFDVFVGLTFKCEAHENF